MINVPRLTVLAACVSLVACATVPNGPSVMAMPGNGKDFNQFRADDAECRQYADGNLNGTNASQASVDSGVKSAAVGAGVGALAGAALGGGRGAGTGAGLGLIVGALAGTNAANASAGGTQRRYDNSYVQCMYSKGNQVPVSAGMAPARRRAPAYGYPQAPGAVTYPPPPPPGYAYPSAGAGTPEPASGYYPPPPGQAPPR